MARSIFARKPRPVVVEDKRTLFEKMGEAGSKVFKVKSQFQIPYISTYDLVRIVRLGESRSNVEGESEFGKPKVGEFGEVVYHNDSGWYQIESLEKGTAQSWMGWFVRTDSDFLYGQHVDQNNLPQATIAIAEKLRIGMTRS